MKKYVLVFPGQGSQYVGMDKNPKNILGENYVNNIWNEVNDALGFDLKNIVQQGPQNQLTLTQNAQPALVTTSYLFLEILKKHFGLHWKEHIHCVLGHSLGEYSALLAAETLTLADAVKITHLRGRFMQEAVPSDVGSMFAILKCPKELVTQACTTVSSQTNQVVIANDNSLEQVVISGHKDACEAAVAWLEKNCQTKFRAMPLQVSAPFHSPLMQPAAEKLKTALSDIKWKNNQLAYISNVDAQLNAINTNSTLICQKLYEQVCGTVRWVESISGLSLEHPLIEVGPSLVLTGLAKKIEAKLSCIGLDQDKNLAELLN